MGASESIIEEGAASDVSDAGKQTRRTGVLVRSVMPRSRVEGGGAPVIDFGSLMAYYVKSSGF
jgi:hypothetical protein